MAAPVLKLPALAKKSIAFMGLQERQSPRGVGRAGWWVGAQADLALVLNV